MEKEPLHIPRKLRNDTFHVMSKSELNITAKFELKRFQSEYEILKIRKDILSERLTCYDSEVSEYISGNSISSK